MLGRRILVVEDEFLLAQDLRLFLEGLGAIVVGPSPRLAAALGLLASGAAIDAAVLDINLAGEVVFPLADALAARNIDFVFVTGFDRSIIPSRFAASPLVQKPVDVTVLETVLRTFFAR